jgi:hypothetical protein
LFNHVPAWLSLLIIRSNLRSASWRSASEYVFRGKLILMLAERASFNTIKQRLQTSAPSMILGLYLRPPQHAAVFCV